MQCSNSANISLFGECRKWFSMLPPYDPIYLCSQNSQKKQHSLLQYIFVLSMHNIAGTPGLDEPQSSSNTVLVAGVAVSVVVLVLAAVCIVVMVIWWR